jgi:hypothetical protein
MEAHYREPNHPPSDAPNTFSFRHDGDCERRISCGANDAGVKRYRRQQHHSADETSGLRN